MKLKFLNTALTGLILSISCLVNSANAGLILSDSTEVNSSGQSYSEVFDVSGFEDYTNLVFTVNVRGDYGTNSSEFIEFVIDDTSFGQFSYNTAGVTSVVGPSGNSSFDYVMDFSFTISDVDWNSLYANDSQLKVQWNNGPGVDPAAGYYVNFSLSAIPEPSTLAIFALGLIGLGLRRFKK
ncbi:MAG: PEP-CTERM sorting domain-containing protein [Colwellia sp.]|nr:PEP-CTERM sorting domain-containing protein [Colwellia sp.]